MNPGNKDYRYYGGRGIEICDRWNDFWNFVADMGYKPDGYTLDRIEGDKGYSPENCRWATRKEQTINRSQTIRISYNGTEQTILEWSEELGLSEKTIYFRFRRGWDTDDILTKPQRKYSK